MNTTQPMTLLRRPRKYACYTFTGALRSVLTEQIGDLPALSLRAGEILEQEALCITTHWMTQDFLVIAITHGSERLRYVSTFEQRRPSIRAYPPRMGEILAFDFAQSRLYLSTRENRLFARTLQFAHALLAPGSELTPCQFSAEGYFLLTSELRHPILAHAPWDLLTLKQTQALEPGEHDVTRTVNYLEDGFDHLGLIDRAFAKRLTHVIFAYRPEGCRAKKLIEFFPRTNLLRVSFAEPSLAAINTLIDMSLPISA